jgi:predicted nucleic acid-binding protein
VSKEPAFWDSSALVPLCVHELMSRQAHSHLRKFLPVVWWESRVEVRSAIATLNRLRYLRDAEKQKAVGRLAILNRSWREILPADPIRELAGNLLDVHQLRAADSLQLAAALTWCQERPSGRTFISADQRLSREAAATGFSVIQLS